MFDFSIFVGDMVADSFESKVRICNELLINNMEIDDSINGTGIVEMSGEEVENIRSMLIDNNKKIVLISCSKPVSEYEYYKLLFRKAHMLKAGNIKVHVWSTASDEQKTLEILKRICSIGASYGIRVLLENCSKTVLASDKKITAIYKSIKQENTGLIFNPLEYAKEKRHPFFHEFYNSKLKNEVRFLRVNDGLFADGSPTLPGEGNAEIKEMASILLARGFSGYFSFVPYFNRMDVNFYRDVIARFKKMLKEM